jgi:urease accessory protein
MRVADRYLGHREESDVAARLSDADPLGVVLSDTDRRRSRVRTETVDGADLGIVVTRELGDGDVLETDDGALVVVELAAVDALVVDFGDADVDATVAVAFGHAAGNRHWDLAVRGDEALFPVPDTRDRMADALAGEIPEGVTTRFEQVPPTTFGDTPTDHHHTHGGNDGGAHDHTSDGGAHGHGHDSPAHAHTHDSGANEHDSGGRATGEAPDE